MGKVSEIFEALDPRFAAWSTLKPWDPRNMNNTCYAYAVADDATIEAYAQRPVGSVMRPPQVGDAYGVNEQIYGMVSRMSVEKICSLAEKDGLKRLDTPSLTEPLPSPSQGHRLVSMVFGRHPQSQEYEYHWLRGHEQGWTQKFGHKNLPKNLDGAGAVITDPRVAKFYLMQQGPFFFECPSEGIDLRLNKDVGDLLDNIHREHDAMEAQAKKRRVDLKRPALAQLFKQLARHVATKDPELATQITLLAELHTTGVAPSGMKLRPGLFK